MLFIFQKQDDFNMEAEVIRQEVLRNKYMHKAIEVSMEELNGDISCPDDYKLEEAVPVGTIEFTEKYLKNVHKIPYMSPLEIPWTLRKKEFLLRDYKIIGADEIPKQGMWFLKDASRLKQFTYCGEMNMFMYDGIFDKPKEDDMQPHIDKDHKFVLSEIMDIMAEYRVFVWNDKIKGIQYYDGDPTIMPNEQEIEKLKRMVSVYTNDYTRPPAYAMDIAVISKDSGRDIALIELCPFACVGLYGFCGSNLPYMYRDGLRWYEEWNEEVKT